MKSRYLRGVYIRPCALRRLAGTTWPVSWLSFVQNSNKYPSSYREFSGVLPSQTGLLFFHNSDIWLVSFLSSTALRYWYTSGSTMSSTNATFVFPDAGEPASHLAYEKNRLIGGFLGCGAWGKFLLGFFNQAKLEDYHRSSSLCI